MSLRDKKLAVLQQLEKESYPVALPQLLFKLGENFKERSVRRWLHELVQEGSVQKIGQKKATKYLVIQKDQTSSISSCFSAISLQVIDHIKKPLFERIPITYAEDWFANYVPNSDYYLPQLLRKQLLEMGARNGNDPAGTYAQQIFNRLLIDLSYNSSRLEGNTYSLLDTERLLLKGDNVEGKLDQEKVMILNHKEAIRYLVENAPRIQLSRNTICTLHYLLSDGLVEPLEAGKVRRHGVRVSGSVYIPFEDPKRLELQLDKIVNKAVLIKDPFEQSIFLLIHVSYLQAFADVNKRTARLSANISLIKNNLVPLAFNDVQVDDYMFAMIAVYELQDIRPLVDLYAFSYMRTCAAYDATVLALGFDAVRVRYRQERRNMIREIILNHKIGEEVMQYILFEAKKYIPPLDQIAFIEDVQEDLEQIDESRLFGLGVTPEQLREWWQKSRSH